MTGSGFSSRLAVGLAAMLSLEAHAQDSSRPACPAQNAPIHEPYRWYPALDLARIPFHVASGPWGPKAAISAPAAPLTTRRVTVTSAEQFSREARIPGTQLTVGAQFIGPVAVASDIADLDIIVPAGHRVAQLTIGGYTPTTSTRRVRIRGTTPGRHSGGVIGGITFASTTAITDVIVDGVDLNGEDGRGGNLLWHFVRGAERVAVVNVRGHAVGPGSLDQQGGTDIVIAGSRLLSAVRAREVNGYPEGWGVRAGGRVVIFDNRIEGSRYHRVRLHPEAGPKHYAWVANNTFVDAHEGRIFSVFNASGSTSYRYGAVWAMCNQVYAHSTCMLPSFDGGHADYAVLTHNSFYGNITRSQLQAGHGSGRDYLTGNTFAAWRTPPAWLSPGDPALIALPPLDPSRNNPTLRGPVCPPP